MKVTFGLALDFGTGQPPLPRQLSRHLELIRAAEQYAFDSVWLGEGYHTAPRPFHLPAPLMMLGVLSQFTHLKLGTGVILLTAWNPLRLAYESALLDQLSEGRLVLGVGLGGPSVWKRFGVARSEVARYADESLAMVRRLWAGEDGFRGTYFSTEGGISPLPAQPGGPRIWVGGGVRRSVERAAEFGDGYYSSTPHPFELVARQARAYRAALEARGKPADQAVVAANRLTLLAESEAEARAGGHQYVGQVLSSYADRESPTLAGRSQAASTAELFDRLGEPLCLVGTPRQVIHSVQRYAEAGVTHIQARLSPGEIPVEAAIRTIRLLGEQVLPEFA